MDFVEGTLASRILQKPTEDEQEELILNPDLDISILDRFYRQVAGYMLQLSRLEFTQIGAISKEPGTDTWSSSKRPLTYNMNELATAAGYPTDELPTTGFARASDYFRQVAHQHWRPSWPRFTGTIGGSLCGCAGRGGRAASGSTLPRGRASTSTRSTGGCCTREETRLSCSVQRRVPRWMLSWRRRWHSSGSIGRNARFFSLPKKAARASDGLPDVVSHL